MDYAIVENGVVVNIIVGLPQGMDGVAIGDRLVAIGDSYQDGVFARDGTVIKTNLERIAELEAALAEIEEALNG